MNINIDFEKWHTDFLSSPYNKPDLLLDDVAHFLFDMMFVSNTYKVIIDTDTRHSVAKCLYYFITKRYERSCMMCDNDANEQELILHNRSEHGSNTNVHNVVNVEHTQVCGTPIILEDSDFR